MTQEQGKWAKRLIKEFRKLIGKSFSHYPRHNGYELKKGTRNFGHIRYNIGNSRGHKNMYTLYAYDYRKDHNAFRKWIDPIKRFVRQGSRNHYSMYFAPEDTKGENYALAVLKRAYDQFP